MASGTMSEYGPWTHLFLPDDPHLIDGRKNIHGIQSRDMQYFFGHFLNRPRSFFRFNELETCQRCLKALGRVVAVRALPPSKAHEQWWRVALAAFVAEVLAFDVDAHCALKENSAEAQEFAATRKMAELAVPVMAGYVDYKDEFCPLCPGFDPDTSWERWALHVSPLENWAFHRQFFIEKEVHQCPGGMKVTMQLDSFHMHPELYERKKDCSWHPIWGYTVYGRFFPYLHSESPALLERIAAAESPEAFYEILVELLRHPSPAIRQRAAFSFVKHGEISELWDNPWSEEIPKQLEFRLKEETDVDVIRCLLAAIRARGPYYALSALREMVSKPLLEQRDSNPMARRIWNSLQDPPEAPSTPVQASRAFTVLIVDDERENAELIVNVLQLKGFKRLDCRFACDGAAGIAAAISLKPDLIFLNYWMPPGMSGTDVCRKLRETVGMQYTRIIIYSVNPNARDASIAAGADAFEHRLSIDGILKHTHQALLDSRWPWKA